MRTTAERLAEAKRRARELERERQRRRAREIFCAGTAACFVMIVSLALVMPGITEGFSDAALGVGMAASIFSGRSLGDRKSTRLNSSHRHTSRMPSSA